MMFVSISTSGRLVRLRRYEGRQEALTHAGCYEPSTATPLAVENYRLWGAPQDRLLKPSTLPRGRRVRATSSA